MKSWLGPLLRRSLVYLPCVVVPRLVQMPSLQHSSVGIAVGYSKLIETGTWEGCKEKAMFSFFQCVTAKYSCLVSIILVITNLYFSCFGQCCYLKPPLYNMGAHMHNYRTVLLRLLTSWKALEPPDLRSTLLYCCKDKLFWQWSRELGQTYFNIDVYSSVLLQPVTALTYYPRWFYWHNSG